MSLARLQIAIIDNDSVDTQSSMRVPAPLVLQSSTNVACEGRSDSVSTELESVYSLTIVAVACPWLWAGSAYSIDFANWSQAWT